jgi:uncharacterized membrane protein
MMAITWHGCLAHAFRPESSNGECMGETPMPRKAQMVKYLLQGKWLGHPLHPAIVHIPTGAWTAALIFDLFDIAGKGRGAMTLTSFACIVIGIAAALLAAPTGLADFWDIKPEKPAHKIGLIHMSLNVLVLLIFIANAALRWNHFRDERISGLELTLTIIGVLILCISGYLGGLMVYDQGIGIARISKKKWREIAVRGNARVPEQKASK